MKALPWLQCTMASDELCLLPEPPFLLCALGYPEAMGREKLIAILLHMFGIIVKPVVCFSSPPINLSDLVHASKYRRGKWRWSSDQGLLIYHGDGSG